MKVKDIALREMHCASPDMNLSEIASMMKRHGVGAIPVCSEGSNHLLGMITDRDIAVSCVAAGMDAAACRAREFMTANPVTISPDADIEDAARLMAKEQVRRLPVVEGDNNIIGILSLGDLAVALACNDGLVAETLRKISTPTHAVLSCEV